MNHSETIPGAPPRRRRSRVVPLLLLIVVVLLAACGYLFYRYRQAVDKPQAEARQAVQLVESLGKILELPKEQPSVATVVDAKKLGDKQLAAEARNGDTLLVYAHARRVVLYRPSSEKVVDMFHIEAAKTENGSNGQ